jgi:hypothetical protein
MEGAAMTCVLCRGARLQSLDAHLFHKCLDCGFTVPNVELDEWDDDAFLEHSDSELVVYALARRANVDYLAGHAAPPLAQICREYLNRGLH